MNNTNLSLKDRQKISVKNHILKLLTRFFASFFSQYYYKKIFVIIIVISMMLLVASCGQTSQEDVSNEVQQIDIDLTEMSGTMVYSQIYDMMINPLDYMGQTIKLEGEFYWEYYQPLDETYYFVIIKDATGCCPQGLEFVNNSDVEFPESGTVIEMVGVFDKYQEGNNEFFRITTDEIVYQEI